MYLKNQGAERVGEGVFRTTFWRASPYSLTPSSHSFESLTWGEALPLRITAGSYLFGLLGHFEGAVLPHEFFPGSNNLFPDLLSPPDHDTAAFKSGETFERVQLLRGEREMPARCWPTLVHYKDVLDPNTVSLVLLAGDRSRSRISPAISTLDLAEAVGAGAAIRRCTVELTQAPVSHETSRLLPWLSRLPSAVALEHERGMPHGALAARLRYRNFVCDSERPR